MTDKTKDKIKRRIKRQIAFTLEAIEQSYDEIVTEDDLKAKLKGSLWLLHEDLLEIFEEK